MAPRRRTEPKKVYYPVERIIDKRTTKAGKLEEYCVKYVGCPLSECHWVPVKDLLGCEDLIKEHKRTVENDERNLERNTKHWKSHQPSQAGKKGSKPCEICQSSLGTKIVTQPRPENHAPMSRPNTKVTEQCEHCHSSQDCDKVTQPCQHQHFSKGIKKGRSKKRRRK